MMKKAGFSFGVMFLVAALLLAIVPEPAAAQDCNVLTLFPCAGAISNPASQPSTACCRGLRQQEPCFCQYLQDPTLSQFFTPEAAQRLASACGVTIPSNC